MPTNTPNYSWSYPDVNGSNGAWGGLLNAVITAIDTSLKTVNDLASAALAKAGGVMTGRLDMLTSSTARKDLGSVSGSVNFDVSLAQYFTLTLNGAMTPAFTNVPAGTIAQGVIWRITNGGSAVISWPASIKWVGGVAPTLTVAGVDLIGFITDDNGATARALVLGKDLR